MKNKTTILTEPAFLLSLVVFCCSILFTLVFWMVLLPSYRDDENAGYYAYPQLNDQLQYEWALLDTQDSLTTYYQHLRTKNVIQNKLHELGAMDIYCEYEGNGVEARCRKPPRRA